MQVRSYEPDDLEQCRALYAEMVQQHREIYDDPSIGGDDPGRGFDRHLGRVGPERVWVAELRRELVGLVSLIFEDMQAEVEPIVVAAAHRGQRVGEKLLQRAVDEARRAGAMLVHARPVARNPKAIGFFHDHGFRTLGHVQLFQWLGPVTPGRWRAGPELFGLAFDC